MKDKSICIIMGKLKQDQNTNQKNYCGIFFLSGNIYKYKYQFPSGIFFKFFKSIKVQAINKIWINFN